MPNQLLNTADIARRCAVSKTWLEKLRVEGGGPPFVKLGRRVLYRESDVNHWIDARLRTSTSDPGDACESEATSFSSVVGMHGGTATRTAPPK